MGEKELYVKDVKKIADREFHKMIDSLADGNRINFTTLPVWVQEELEKANLAVLERVKNKNGKKDMFVDDKTLKKSK